MKNKNTDPIFEVTNDQVEESIAQEIHMQAGFKTSVCVLILNTGAEVIGSFSPVDVNDEKPLNVAENKKLARKEAFEEAENTIKSVVEWQRAVYFTNLANKKKEVEGAHSEKTDMAPDENKD